jgi:hypothetical protein
VGGQLELQAAGGLGGEALVQFEQHVVGMEGAAAQVQAAGIVAGQVEQVAHQGAHALGLLLDQSQGRRLGAAALQGLHMAGDQGDRRAQFVGHAIHEAALPLPGVHQPAVEVVVGDGDRLQLLGLRGHGDGIGGIGRHGGGTELGGELAQGQHQAAAQHQAQQGTGELAGHPGCGQQQPEVEPLAVHRGGHVHLHQQTGAAVIGQLQRQLAEQPLLIAAPQQLGIAELRDSGQQAEAQVGQQGGGEQGLELGAAAGAALDLSGELLCGY